MGDNDTARFKAKTAEKVRKRQEQAAAAAAAERRKDEFFRTADAMFQPILRSKAASLVAAGVNATVSERSIQWSGNAVSYAPCWNLASLGMRERGVPEHELPATIGDYVTIWSARWEHWPGRMQLDWITKRKQELRHTPGVGSEWGLLRREETSVSEGQAEGYQRTRSVPSYRIDPLRGSLEQLIQSFIEQAMV